MLLALCIDVAALGKQICNHMIILRSIMERSPASLVDEVNADALNEPVVRSRLLLLFDSLQEFFASLALLPFLRAGPPS